MYVYVALFYWLGSDLLMYECFHCCTKSVVWQADFSFEDYGMEGEGIIHVCKCMNCGADIEYYISCGDPDEEDGET